MKNSFLFLLTISLVLVACNAPQNQTEGLTQPSPSSVQATDHPSQTKPLVVTTVAPITNIVSNIAGDRIDVKGIIPEGGN